MTQTTKVYSSFRDPAGGVFESNGRLYRRISPDYSGDYSRLMSSGLYNSLRSRSLIIPHVDSGDNLITPVRVKAISYPYEWCFSMLKDAALATLDIQLICLEYGMQLKDASAYNIQFFEGRPVLIDTLSIIQRRRHTPWMAYGQFCRHFLGPLTLMSKVDTRLGQLLRNYLDGVPLDLVSKLLPFSWDPRINIHIKVHSKFIDKVKPKETLKDTQASDFSQIALLNNLKSLVTSLSLSKSKSGWSQYKECSYTGKALQSKCETIDQILKSGIRGSLLDLGANTGNFSSLAYKLGYEVVSVDSSHECVEEIYKLQRGRAHWLSLLMDLTNPCTGVGWESLERPPLQNRVRPKIVMALALIHHLAISGSLPLDYLAKYFKSWNCPVLIEFVPKSDPQVKKLFPGGLDIFPEYTEDRFVEVLSSEFDIQNKYLIDESVRTLYYMVPR